MPQIKKKPIYCSSIIHIISDNSNNAVQGRHKISGNKHITNGLLPIIPFDDLVNITRSFLAEPNNLDYPRLNWENFSNFLQ